MNLISRNSKVLLLAWLVAGVAAPLAWAQSHSATKPVPRNDGWWKDRAKLLDERLGQTPDTQVLFIGDSITQGWEGEGKEVWQRFYASRKAVNLGIGGDRTQHVLWRLDHAPLEKVQPRAAVVMIGTNNSNGEDNTPGQIADGVAAILQRLRQKLPRMKVILLAIFPRGENFNAQRGKLCQINQVLQKFDDGQNVFFVDIGHRFLNPDGTLTAGIMPDYLHLSAAGYQLWGEAIETRLATLLGEPAAQARPANVSGAWTWKIKGPNEELIEAPLVLKEDGGKVSGTFHAQGDRKLDITQGTLSGNELKLTVRRQRSQGGEMVYEMTGTIAGDQIQGKVTTLMEGRPVTQDWSAKRN